MLESHSALPDGLHDGVLITLVRSHGSRSSSFMLEFDGIAYGETLCLRPTLMRRPVIASTLPTRVETIEKKETYAWLDSTGRYRAKLDFDRSDREAGYSDLLVRMAKPYAGKDYDWPAPLLDGTEVSIAFDPDKRVLI